MSKRGGARASEKSTAKKSRREGPKKKAEEVEWRKKKRGPGSIELGGKVRIKELQGGGGEKNQGKNSGRGSGKMRSESLRL